MLWADRVSDGGSWAILARDFRRKPSRVGRAKEERGPVETDAAAGIRKERGFPLQLEKASHKALSFFTVPTGPATATRVFTI
jgi:hypothetical protein